MRNFFFSLNFVCHNATITATAVAIEPTVVPMAPKALQNSSEPSVKDASVATKASAGPTKSCEIAKKSRARGSLYRAFIAIVRGAATIASAKIARKMDDAFGRVAEKASIAAHVSAKYPSAAITAKDHARRAASAARRVDFASNYDVASTRKAAGFARPSRGCIPSSLSKSRPSPI